MMGRILVQAHAASAVRFLRQGLPPSAIDNDPSRLVIAFYCLATLDILGCLESATTEHERAEWRKWLWDQQIKAADNRGTGFRGSPYTNQPSCSQYDPPFLIMTYAALLSLAILRDPFDRLDKPGILQYLRTSQREDGSFRLYPTSEEYDLRMSYCAFAICAILNDWTSLDIPAALAFIQSCRTYEGGYGQEPRNEAHGGSTYCALAALALVPPSLIPAPTSSQHPSSASSSSLSALSSILTPFERQQTLRWLVHQQTGLPEQQQQKENGEDEEVGAGFAGRTNKLQDACYCFWCGAAVTILGSPEIVNSRANARFLLDCQFKFGGIRKDKEAHPDPYHTYLGLASLCILSKPKENGLDSELEGSPFPDDLDARWNTTSKTRKWIEDRLHTTNPTNQ